MKSIIYNKARSVHADLYGHLNNTRILEFLKRNNMEFQRKVQEYQTDT